MSTLATTVLELRQEIQRYFGYGRNTLWSTINEDAQGDVLSALNRGMRQFYNPMPLPGESSAHEWSFLRGFSVVSTAAPYSTGTITSSGVTITGQDTSSSDTTEPTFTASMVGRILYADGQAREIVSFTNSDVIVVDRAFSSNLTSTGSPAVGQTYEIWAVAYDMPSDFGGLKGQITFEDGEGYSPLTLVNESAIRHMRSQESVFKSVPEYAALVPKTVATGTASQQVSQLLVWPIPDQVYDLHFAYTVMTDRVYTSATDAGMDTSDTYYPVGAMVHGETLLASCLAIAEQMMDEFNNPGKMHAKYMERLASSISYDRRNALPDGFGYNFDNSDRNMATPSRRRLQNVSYRNSTYPS